MSLVASAFRRKKHAASLLLPLLLAVAAAPPPRVETLRSTGGLPAHIAGSFRDPLGFQQSDSGQYFVFDRRAHAVYTIAGDTATKIVDIGSEPGRVLDPTAFDIDPSDGSFVVADAPLRRSRIQVFTADGRRLGGFTLPEREKPRLMLDNMVLNGIGSIQYTGRSLLINQPETGGLVSELELYGTAIRSFGELRRTGPQRDAHVHLALNAGLPLADPTGGDHLLVSRRAPPFSKTHTEGPPPF